MAGFTTLEGAKYALDMIYKGSSPHRSSGANLEIGLFVNTSGLSAGSVLADIVEPTAGGYARVDLTNASWDVSATSAAYAAVGFTASGTAFANDIMGYFIATKGTAAVALHIEIDSSGPVTITDGSIYRVDLDSDL